MHIKSGLHCRTYPRVGKVTFKEARRAIEKHLSARCSECEDYFQKFLRTEPSSGKVTVRDDAVRRWTLNGPTTSLKKHPQAIYFVESLQDVLATAESHNEVIARILYFEYRTLERNHTLGVKRSKSLGGQFNKNHSPRRQHETLRPWELGEQIAEDAWGH